MPNRPTLAQLISEVALEPEPARALNEIVKASLTLTASRHAILAILNDELGCLEVRYGAGEEWETKGVGLQLAVDTKRDEGIVAFVAATGNMVTSNNVAEEPRYRTMFSTTASEIAVPVRDRYGRIRAVLNLESDRLNNYSREEEEVCRAIASLVAVVMDQTELATREKALVEISRGLDNSLTEEVLIDRVIHVASDVLRFQACSIFLLDPPSDTFVLRGSVGRLKDLVGEIAYTRGEGCTGWVCENGQPILLNSPQTDPRWRGRYLEVPSEQIVSFLAVPILSRKTAIGAIRVIRRVTDNKYLDNRFTEADMRLLEAIADQVASGLENIRNMERIIRSERMIAWGELSAKSSHMIGNRVFALKGDINELYHLLAEAKPDVKEIRDIQKSLSTNVMRIEEILMDFRDFLSATQLNRQPTDVNQVVRETVDEVFPRRSEVSLEMHLAEDLPPVSVDSKKLRRAVSELIENSFNYMVAGSLRVDTSVVDKNQYAVTQRSRTSTYVRIEIEDSGPGVDNDKKNMIFQPFFSGRVKGMGLGLSIVKGIVDAHGGEVFEAGEEGKGANFVILLPVAERL